MIQIIKWTSKKPTVPGLYWHRSVACIQDAPVEASEGVLISVVERNQGKDDIKVVGLYSTALNTSHIIYVYIENMGGEWAEFNAPYLNTEDIRVLVDSLALNAGMCMENANDASEILDSLDAGLQMHDEIKQVRDVLTKARADVTALRSLSDKLGLLFNDDNNVDKSAG